MSGKSFGLSILASCCVLVVAGCLSQPPLSHTRQEILYEQGRLQKFAYAGDFYEPPGGATASTGRASALEALTLLKQCDPTALPQLADLPRLEPSNTTKAKQYIGLIQNLSSYDVAIPSANSQATLIVPAYGWLEYTTWQPEVRLAGFVDGKQVYFQQLRVKPRFYQYLGNHYDFIATIRPEPSPPAPMPRRASPKSQKRRRS